MKKNTKNLLILSLREKPILPLHLKRFEVLYNMMDKIPLGPPYKGNGKFKTTRLSIEAIKYIHDNRETQTVVAIVTALICDFGFFIRPETVVNHFDNKDETKYWQLNKFDYLEKYEESVKGTLENHYKPFIQFCIENNYEYFQIAKVLNRAPSSIRRWVNKYGYKAWDKILLKTSDHTGKSNRVEKVSSEQLQLDRMSQKELNELPDMDSLDSRNVVKRGNNIQIYEPQQRREEIHLAIELEKWRSEDMLLILPTELPFEVKKILNEKVTWKQVCKRTQNPSMLYVVKQDDKDYLLQQVLADPHNGVVELQIYSIVNAGTIKFAYHQ